MSEAPHLTVEIDVIQHAELPSGAELDPLVALIRFVLQAEGQSGAWAIALVLTTDDALRILHRDFLGIDDDTDVMTFPADEERNDVAQGGDIVVSVERAAHQASDFGLTPWDEVRFLAVHGTLHLCGWDDTTDVDRDRMLGRQRELIATFDNRSSR